MAERKPSPLFLQQTNYRRRRIHDAARVVPVIGGVLVFLPMLWPQESETNVSTGSAFVYVFGIWAVMILMAAVLAPWLARREEE